MKFKSKGDYAGIKSQERLQSSQWSDFWQIDQFQPLHSGVLIYLQEDREKSFSLKNEIYQWGMIWLLENNFLWLVGLFQFPGPVKSVIDYRHITGLLYLIKYNKKTTFLLGSSANQAKF